MRQKRKRISLGSMEISHEPIRNPDGLDRMQVIQALQFYESLVRRQSSTTYYRAVLRQGKHSEELKIWKPFCEMARFCNAHNINFLKFIQAQFEEWVKPNPYASSYPTAHWLGANKGCVARYNAWVSRIRESQEARRPERVKQAGEAVLRNILMSRSDLKTISDVLSDPFLVRLLPRDFVRELPEFEHAAIGLRNDPASSAILHEYLQ